MDRAFCGFVAATAPNSPRLLADEQRRPTMLWTIVAILLILWLLGFSFHVAGGLVHILLVVAVIVIVFNLLSGRRAI
jgi:hypothetical protein